MNRDALDFIQEDYENVFKKDVKTFSGLKNTTVVITGGSGFMGTWLMGMLAYLNDHYQFNTALFLIARNTEHFKLTRPHLSQRKDVSLIETDVRSLLELPTETSWLIHCAGTPNARFHASNPFETMSIIAQGTQAVLQAAERCSHLKMIMNVSSGLVYGAQPFNQEYLAENFRGAPPCSTVSSAYAEAKRYAETLCSAVRSQARIPIVTVRPFAFVGPYQPLDAPWALNNFIYDALQGNTIRVLGDGKTVRSYLYASDMAYWMLKILVNSDSGEVYNLGSSQSISLYDLAKVIAEQIEPRPFIQVGGSSNKDMAVSRFVPDLASVQKKFRLDVSVDIKTAIRRTLEWHKICNTIF